MSTTQQNTKTQRRYNYRPSLIYIIGGAILIVGWTLVLAVTTWLVDLPCAISPTACTEGRGLAQLILFTPLVVGSIMLPVGVLYSLDIPRPLKFFAVVGSAAIVFFLAYWAMILIGISVHGLGA